MSVASTRRPHFSVGALGIVQLILYSALCAFLTQPTALKLSYASINLAELQWSCRLGNSNQNVYRKTPYFSQKIVIVNSGLNPKYKKYSKPQFWFQGGPKWTVGPEPPHNAVTPTLFYFRNLPLKQIKFLWPESHARPHALNTLHSYQFTLVRNLRMAFLFLRKWSISYEYFLPENLTTASVTRWDYTLCGLDHTFFIKSYNPCPIWREARSNLYILLNHNEY